MANTTLETHTVRLSALRQALQEKGVEGFIVSVGDEYQNEYPPDSAKRLEWLTGFTGSAGIAVILQNKAALFVDGRYTLQAASQVPGKYYEHHNIGQLRPEAWAAAQLSSGSAIGYDPWLHTLAEIRRYERALPHAALRPLTSNPIDALWKDRPPIPCAPAFAHPEKYSGESSASKRVRIATELKKKNIHAALITMPESICWLLNLRGGDVEMTPLLLAFAVLHDDGKVTLHVSAEKITADVKAHLGPDITLSPPEALEETFQTLGRKKARVLYDGDHSSIWFYRQLTLAGAEVVEGPDPTILPKAQKNKVELGGMRHAHARDGAAMVKFLCWLENELAKRKLTEMQAAMQLHLFRAESDVFHGPSFPTIAGAGPHGAIVHYRADEENNRIIDRNNFLLLDSGAQYPDGTTDITRTLPIGTVSAEQKENFTRVLKGHIALARAVFPQGTTGAQLDALARVPLWQAGLDYDHGTGHGVGSYLGVHEGPQRISKRGDVALLPGMILSNEPGYYKTGKYGIRIENLVAVIPAAKGFLQFETLTMVPIDTRAVQVSLLTPEEKSWLNAYHTRVKKVLSPLLGAKEKTWLAKRCKAI